MRKTRDRARMEANMELAVLHLREALRTTGIHDPAGHPIVQDQVIRWTDIMNGRPLLEAMAFLFAGAVGVKAHLEQVPVKHKSGVSRPILAALGAEDQIEM